MAFLVSIDYIIIHHLLRHIEVATKELPIPNSFITYYKTYGFLTLSLNLGINHGQISITFYIPQWVSAGG